jgi:hypothetical protein
MNSFTRGVEIKKALNLGLKENSVEILRIGYNKNQPHNKEHVVRILENLNDPNWQDLFVEYVYKDPKYEFQPVSTGLLRDILSDKKLRSLQFKEKYYVISSTSTEGSKIK